jgi:hypothetical protein
MPFEKFDRSKLNIKPLSSRVSDLSIECLIAVDEAPMEYANPKIDVIADRILKARGHGAAVIMMYGAHVIRSGCAALMTALMERGLITHFATNGAGAIHDFELALCGETCESVAKYISEGQFGLWRESALINDAVTEGAAEGLGAGEAIGKYIEENNFKYKKYSVLAAGYRQQVPVTVHIGIGSDIAHEHPNFDPAATGKASYDDFLIYARSVENLEGGVFLNFGSAVTGPEVYLKCLAMARNVARQESRRIARFTTAVFDLLPLEGADFGDTPPKNDPRYYFRPWKTILTRTVADGGESFYVEGEHKYTVTALARTLLRKFKKTRP